MLKQSLLILGLVTVLGSCEVNQNTSDILVGKWTISDITFDDTITNPQDALLLFVLPEISEAYVEFTSDNKYKVFNKEDSLVTTGEYELSGDGKTLTSKENGETQSMEIKTVTKSQISLISEEGTGFTLNRKP